MYTDFSMFLPLSEKPVRVSRQIVHTYGSEKSCLVIRSTETGIQTFFRFIQSVGERWKVKPAVLENISIAVSEAIHNAVEHGNKSSYEKTVTIHAMQDELHFTFTIDDEGDGFDYRDIKDPTLPENLSCPAGRGIFLIYQLADKVQFTNGGSRVKLTFCR